MKPTQLPLFDHFVETKIDHKASRSGAFVDNMALPLHRWFRYSAGFSAEWVENVLRDWKVQPDEWILDPFSGSATVPLVADQLGLNSIGVEAHPVVMRIARAKLSWASSINDFVQFATEVQYLAARSTGDPDTYPELIQRSFEKESLAQLDTLKAAWEKLNDGSTAAELTWLVITAILRPCSTAGTAQWQYILPNKTKKRVVAPAYAFTQQLKMMVSDLKGMQERAGGSKAILLQADARDFASQLSNEVRFVITSPPYANNYDYADALRFEMTFWGEVNGWGDIHDKVRKYLIVSSSQHASKEKLVFEDVLDSPLLTPIRPELEQVVHQLAHERENHGGKKHYHSMVAAYCRDIALVLREIKKVGLPQVRMCWVIGDSAPYGVYCPIDRWIGEMALYQGFSAYNFEKLRDRNTKWKNRKHQVPLKEGLLWISGL